MPVPFSPGNGVHNTTFKIGSRVEIEARHWYCSLAWTQLFYNEALAARSTTDVSVARLREVIEYFTCSLRRLYAFGVSRYDYLSLRQTEPALAEASSHADAVPRTDGARRYLARIARQETLVTAKLGAADRGFVYPHRGGRAAASATATAVEPKQPETAHGRRQPRGGGPPRGAGRSGRGRGAGRAQGRPCRRGIFASTPEAIPDPEASCLGSRTRKHKHRRRLPAGSPTNAVLVYRALRAALQEWESLGAHP